jgi:hypothetical protein
MGAIAAFAAGTAAAVALYWLAHLLNKHIDIFHHPDVIKWVEVFTLVLALFAGIELAAASFGQWIDHGIRNLAGVLGVLGSVILAGVVARLLFVVGKALLQKGRATLGRSAITGLLLGGFPAATVFGELYAWLATPANVLSALIIAHVV